MSNRPVISSPPTANKPKCIELDVRTYSPRYSESQRVKCLLQLTCSFAFISGTEKKHSLLLLLVDFIKGLKLHEVHKLHFSALGKQICAVSILTTTGILSHILRTRVMRCRLVHFDSFPSTQTQLHKNPFVVFHSTDKSGVTDKARYWWLFEKQCGVYWDQQNKGYRQTPPLRYGFY